MLKNPQVFASKTVLIEAATRHIDRIIAASIQEKSKCTLVLAGGSTPKDVYAALSKAQVDWRKMFLYWGDERMVPRVHDDSNYKMVVETLLKHVNIPGENIFRIKGELPPHEAAANYEAILNRNFKGAVPVFDVVLLGLGDDGHTASLFPCTDILNERQKKAAAVYVAKFSAWRVSLTYSVLNNAANIIFLVSGRSKAEIVSTLSRLERPSPDFPASLIAPENGTLTWMLDKEAAVGMINNQLVKGLR